MVAIQVIFGEQYFRNWKNFQNIIVHSKVIK